MRKHVKWIISLLLVLSVLLSSVALCETAEPTQEAILKSRESYTKVIELNGVRYLVYAQNSPEWASIRAGEHYNINMGDSMCAVFSFANLLVNCVQYDDLNRVSEKARTVIRIDTKNVTPGYGYKMALKFTVADPADYFRYLPLCIANIVSGNNKGLGNQPQSRGYYDAFLKLYDLDYEKKEDLRETIEYLESHPGKIVSVCTGGKDSPIAPNYGHYMLMVQADSEYVYFIDSIFRDEYPYDKKGIIELIEPGLFRVKRSNIKEVKITGVKFIVTPSVKHTAYTTEDLKNVIKISNKNKLSLVNASGRKENRK